MILHGLKQSHHIQHLIHIIDKNYIVFVENDGFYDNLIFGELKTPFEKEIGNEDYKNLDFGDSLIYEIPLYYASKVKIKFEAYLNKEVKEKIYINNHPIGVWHIKENQYEFYEKQIVPPILDSILRIKIERKQGDKVYLGKLSIYIEERKGGIQGDKIENILRFSLNISPNIIKG